MYAVPQVRIITRTMRNAKQRNEATMRLENIAKFARGIDRKKRKRRAASPEAAAAAAAAEGSDSR